MTETQALLQGAMEEARRRGGTPMEQPVLSAIINWWNVRERMVAGRIESSVIRADGRIE